jgi:hypothetical protein
MFIGILIFSAILLAAGLTEQQLQLVRMALGPGSGVDRFVTVLDAPIAGEIAYMAPDRTHIYVDFDRLKGTFNTTWNVLRHEARHTLGGQHYDGSPEMYYSVRTDGRGKVQEDNFLL